MKVFYVFFLMFFLVSCSTTQKETSKNKSVKVCKPTSQYDELASALEHLKAVINSQKGVEASSKSNLIKIVEESFQNFRKLRNEELQILKTLISKSIRYKNLSKEDVKNKNYFIKRLDRIYSEKEVNILKIINQLKQIGENKIETQEFELEMLKYLEPIL